MYKIGEEETLKAAKAIRMALDGRAARMANRTPHAVSVRPPGRVPARVSAAFAVSRIGCYACPPYVLLPDGGGGGGGAQGQGAWACRGGAPGRQSASTTPRSLSGVRGPACQASSHCRRIWPSPASLLA